MNAPVLLAQLAGSPAQTPASPKNLKIEKPQNGQAVTVQLDGTTKLDLAGIASEKLTFVRVGEKLVILFDNQSTVTVDPVFDNNGRPVTDLAFDMGADRTLNGEQFAQAFPITTDQSVLPAAGGATGPTGGASFSNATVGALAGSGARLGLLAGEDGAGGFVTDAETQANATPNPNGVTAVILNEDGFAEGNLGGSGDAGGIATSVTGSLNVNFGTDSVGRSFVFDAAQPGLQGLTSGGQAVQLAIVNVGGVPTLIGYVGTDSSVAANQVFTITLNVTETGDSYTFNLLRPLDHSQPGTVEETLDLTISVTAIDGSSDTAPVTIQIGINDDTPTIGVPAGVTVIDPLDSASSAQSGSLGISWGSDRFNNTVDGGVSGSTGGNGDRSVVFTSAAVSVSGASANAESAIGALTANGEVVRYVLLANGTTLVAYTGGTEPALPGSEVGSNIVFIVTLSDASNTGSYTITQYQPLDHVSGNQNFSTIDLSFQFTARDSDGDPVSGGFTVRVTDTAPTTGEAVAAQIVGEDGLSGANMLGGSYDAADNASLSNIALNINWGADNDTRGNSASDVYGRTLSFLSGGETQNPLGAGNAPSLALVITGENGAVLTSGGVELQYVVTVNANGGETLTAYKGVPGEGNAVFTVTLDPTAPNGAYSFTLIGQLDHASNSNSISLTFTVQSADADGDTVNTSFTVNVQDDTPVAHEVTAPTILDDEAQILFPGNNTPADGVSNANVAQGSAGTLFTAGADGVKSITISGGAFQVVYKDADGFAQTESITWGAGVTDANGNTTFTATSVHYTGSEGGNAAATLVINIDGSYTYTAYAPVVQSTATSGANPTEENTTIKIEFVVTDGDGDPAAGSLSVNVNDDTPVAHVVTARVLDDEAQTVFKPTNSGTGFLGDVSPNYNSVQGNAGSLFTAGADGVKSVILSTAPSFDVIYKDNLGFAQKESVTWGAGVTDANGNTTFKATSAHYTGENNAGVAAILVVGADGSYSLTLFAPVVHDIKLPGVEENKLLSFGVTVTDGDGDQATATLRVNVNDDTPAPIASIVVAAHLLDDEAQSLFPGNDTPTDGVANNKVVTGAAGTLFSMGADGLGSLSVALPTLSVIYAEGGFAKTEGVTWSAGVRSADGTTTFTATSGHYSGTNGNGVAATLVIRADGSYSFELGAPVVQSGNGEDNKILTFLYTVTDGDGDPAGGSLFVTVNDDVPVAKVVTAAAVLDDEQQSVFPGNAGGAGDVPNANAASGTAGTLFTAGADGMREVTISGGAFDVVYKDGGFAKTEGVTWGAGVKGTDGSTTFTASSDHHATAAKLVIGADGSYTFTVFAPVVQATTGTTEENKTIKIDFVVTDGDGDTATGSLSVDVNDDTPVAHSVTAAKLDDEAQTLFTPTNSGGLGDVSPNINSVTGAAGSLFTAGSDGVRSVTLAGPAFNAIYKDGDGFAQIESVTWGSGVEGTDGTTTFTATGATSNQTVATLIVGADGSYKLTLSAPVAHDIQLPGIEENKTLTFGVTVTDGDGDPATATLRVDVNDDTPVPVASIVFASQVMDDEAQTLFTPMNNGGIGDVSPNVGTVSGGAGTLFNMGADGLGSLSVGLPSFNAIYNENGFAKVEGVDWSNGVRSTDGVTTFTAKGHESSNTVAVLVIKADGSYSFMLSKPVAHDIPLPGIEETKTLTFSYTATDGDGDGLIGSLSVSVNDDTPTAKVFTASTVLDDEAQGIFTPVNTGGTNDVLVDTNTVHGDAGTLFSAGADGLRGVTISGGAFDVVYRDGGFAKTEAISWGAGVKGTDGSTTFTASSAHYANAAKLAIGADGSYTFTVSAPVVQATAGTTEESKTIKINFTVTDGDGDTASGSLSVDVNDDTPVAHNIVSATVLDDEAQTVFPGNAGGTGDVENASVAQGNAGTLFTAGADGVKSVTISGGAFDVVYKDGGFAKTESVTWGAGAKGTDGTTTFTASSAHYASAAKLVIGADGSYTFTVFAPVVQPTIGATEENKTIKINFTVTDGDGDTAAGSLSVDVNDDTPVAKVVTAATVLDDEKQALFPGNVGGTGDVADASVAQGTAGTLFTAGADGVKSVTISGGAFDVVYKDGGFAKTESVTWGAGVTDANGNTTFMAKSAHYTGTGGSTVAATLVIGADGSYTFSVFAPVVQATATSGANPTEENKTIKIDFAVTDGDGDTAAGSLSVDVNDDTPVAKVVTATTVLDDEAQTIFAPNAGGVSGDVTPDTNTVSGTAGSLFTAGADGVKSVAMTSATFGVIYKDANGFAQTETATWGSPVVGANGATTWTATSAHYTSGAAVLVINADGSYTFTVNAPIVHPTNSTNEEDKALTFNFTVTDGDGDTATGSLTVDVNDDTVVLGTAVAGFVDEGNLAGGNKDNGYPGDLTVGQGDNGTHTTSGSLAIAFGADGKAATVMGGTQTQIFTFNGNSTLAPDLIVTQGAVNHPSASGVVFGGIGNPIIINATDSLPFKLNSLDLGLSGAPTTPTVILKGYDSNNNLIATYTLSVANVASLVSGTPTHFDAAGTPFANLLIDRLEIYTGNGFSGYVMADNLAVTQNTSSGPMVVDAAVTFTDHANGSANLVVKDANGNDVTASLMSNGAAVHYAMIDAVTLIGYTGATAPTSLSDVRVVFSAVLSSASANGSYTFSQNATLDHPIAGQDDDLVFTFNFTAKDGDGDKANGHFTVTVDDDAPTLSNPALGANLITNGQFLDNTNFGSAMGWGGQSATGSIQGWVITGADLERNPSNWYVTDPVNGGRVVDLDASPGNVTLTQTLTNLILGESYTLSFDAAKPDGFSAKTEVWWNGVRVGIVEPTGNFQQFSFTFTAIAGTNTLEFREVGLADNGGTFLANVQLHTSSSIVDEDALSGGNVGGQGDGPGTAIATGGLGINWGSDNRDVVDANGLQDGAGALNSMTSNLSALTGRAVYFTDSDSVTAGLQPAITATAGSTTIALMSQGQVVKYQVLENGTAVVGYTGTFDATNPSNWVFKASLSDDANGSYKLTLFKPVDHPVGGSEDDITLNFGFTARDADGDTVSGTFSVTIDDDTPVATKVADVVTVSEVGLTLVDAHTGFLNVSWGADKGDGKHLNFAKDADGKVIGPVLYSNGVMLEYRVEPESVGSDNERLIAYRANDPTKSAVFSITLYEPGNPYYTVALFGPLDHAPGSDPLTLGFTVVATDADGDSLNVPITVRVIDSVPTATAVADTVTVSETGLPLVDAHTGFLNVSWGADKGAAKHLNFAKDADGKVIGPVLYSNGVMLEYRVEPESAGSDNERLIAYRANDPTKSAVFSITLYEPGNPYYTVALFGPLDHAPGSDPLTLGFTVVATDADGDALNVPITVRVIDSVPTATAVADTVTVSETGLPLVDAHTGFLNVSWGADKGAAKHLNFAKDNAGEVVGPMLTSGGVLLAYRVEPESAGSDNERLIAYRIDDPSKSAVFSITLYEPGNPYYTMALFGPLDHALGNNPLTLSFTVIATDADGDPLNVPISIVVQDDVPVAGDQAASAATTTYEDGARIFTATLDIDFGADNAHPAVAFISTVLTLAGSSVVSALTSYGQTVNIAYLDAAHTILVGYTGNTVPTDLNATNLIFVVTLDAAGTYKFDLRGPIDHPAPNGSNEQFVDIGFAYQVTDSDGDTDDGTFAVRIDAAGTIGSIHYDTLTTGVFVNLADTATTLNGQTVAANTATDLTSGGGHVVGNDAMGTISEAHGSKANDILVGGDEDNVLYGNDGDDTLSGGLGADRLYGGAGNDTFLLGKDVTGSGTRTFQLGDGSTVEVNIEGLAGTMDPVEGGSGYDKIILNKGSASGYVYDAYRAPSYISGVEEIVGTDGDDVIMVSSSYRSDAANGGIKIDGGKGRDYLGGGAGDDTIDGGDGDDVISGLGGDDVLNGGNGADTIYGGDGKDTIRGGSGNDKLFGDAGEDLIYGGDGADEIHGGADNDELHGEGGDDTIYGDGGNDTIYGGDGKDTIYGGEGNDSLYGQNGDDIIIGGLGNDKIGGGDGDDRILYTVGDGNDTVDGGAGYDTLEITGDAVRHDFVVGKVASGLGPVQGTPDNKVDLKITYADDNNDVGGTIYADSVEKVVVNVGSGNDNVTVGDLTGTGIAPATVVINSGSGDNTFDLRNLAGTVVDINDSDSVQSGDTDTVKLAGKWTDYTFTVSGDTYTVTRNSDHVVLAHVTNVEQFFFQGENGGNGATIPSDQLVNAAPHANDDTQSVKEDTLPGTAQGNAISNDVDANSLDHLTVNAVQVGNVSTAVTDNGVTVIGTYGTLLIKADGSYTYTLNNSDPQTNALTEGQQVTETFTYTLKDVAGLTDTGAIEIKITGTNDTPVLSVTGNTTTYVEADGADSYGSFVFAGLSTTITDVDTGASFSKVTITITNAQSGDDLNMFTTPGQRVLSDGTHINYSTATANGQLTMTFTNAVTGGKLTGAEIDEAIKTLVRFHTGDRVASNTPDRQIDVTVYDDLDAASNVVRVSLDVQGTNDTPTWANTSLAASVDEDQSFSLNQFFTSQMLKVSDRDADGDAKLSLHVDHGTLTFASANGVTVTHDAATNTYTLTGTMAQLNNLLVATNGVKYTPDANYHGTDALTLTFSDNGDLGLAAKQAVATITIDVASVNDKPVITSDAAAAQGAVTEAGDLALVREAGVGGPLKLAASLAGNAAVVNAFATLDGLVMGNPLPPLPTLADVQAAITAIKNVSDAPTAIAAVWQHLDAIYTLVGSDKVNVNAAFTMLGVAYADYLKAGGMPLVDVVAKFTADGSDADTLPDRLQSLHDNLLGNVTDYALHQRYDGVGLYTQMHDLVAAHDATVLTRSPQPVTGNASDPAGLASDAHTSDMAHGQATHVSGQLTASDVDGDTLAWSIAGTSSYGAMAIDAATGKWTYTLDDTLAATQALGAGDSVTETFTAVVSDGHGGSVSHVVTITIKGTNDAPVLTHAAADAAATIYAGGGLDHVVMADVATADPATTHKFEIDQNIDSKIAALLAATPDNMHTVLVGVQSALGHAAGFADAIAAVWDYVDDHYSYYNTAINAVGVRLAIEYANYVKTGGEPLTGIIVQYKPDGGDAGTAPDRVQSMHDNLLGNLDAASLNDKFLAGGAGGSNGGTNGTANPVLHGILMGEIAAAGLSGRPYYGGYENENTNPAHGWDATHGLLPGGTHQVVSGQLTATDIDTNDAGQLTWSLNTTATPYGTMSINAATGKWTYDLDNSLTATRALGAGQTVTESFIATVTDGYGGTASQTIAVTIKGTNDAPVLTHAAADAAATIYAGGGLDHVVMADVATADPATTHKFEIDQNIDSKIAALLATTPDNMHTVLVGVQSALGHAAGFADAIAAVWDYVDDHYSYYNTTINAVGVRLAIEYANYVKTGGEPLTGIIVKYTPDGGDAGTAPDRAQSMHDNLLGNLDAVSMIDKFLDSSGGGSNGGANGTANPALYSALIAEITAAGLSGRPYYGGYENENANPAHGWDATHGLLPGGTHQVVSGQLTATDVDTNDAGQLTWSLNTTATPYGTMSIDAATGKWTYDLDNGLAATRALGANQTVTESFIATVTDGHGGSASQTIVVTIKGTNDAPEINFSFAGPYASAEDTPVHLTQADINGFISQYVTDADNSNANLTYTYSIGGQSITFTGSAPAEGFTFTPPANFHGTLQGFFSVSDGLATTTKTFTYNVTAVNDAPILSNVASVTVAEDTTLYLKTAGWVADDVDRADGRTPVVTLTLKLTSGDGVLSAISNGLSGTFDIVTSDNGKTLTITTHDDGGSRDAYAILNSLLRGDNFSETNKNGIAFTPGQDFNGPVTVSYSIDDHGSYGAAGSSVTNGNFSINVTPVNDAPTFSSAPAGVAYNDTVADDTFGAVTGTLAANDPDQGDTKTFSVNGGVPSSVLPDYNMAETGPHGVLYLNTATGDYRYEPNDAAIEALRLGASDSFIFSVTDGSGASATQNFTVLMTAANDTPTITGTDTVALTETNAIQTTGGTLTVVDRDAGESAFVAQTDAAGSNAYGKFTIDANGVWSYTMNSAHDEFVDGVTYTDSVTVKTVDGTTQVLTVTILGTSDNHAPEFGAGSFTGGVTGQLGVQPANAVVNGGFESGGNGWTVTGTDSASVFGSDFPADGSGGYRAYSFGDHGTISQQLKQTIETIAGVQYTLSFKVMTSSETASGHLYVNWNGQQILAVASAEAKSNSAYTTFTTTVIGTGGDTLQFVINDDNTAHVYDSWRIDTVSLTPPSHNETTSGVIAFSDLDASDVHSVVVSAPVGSSYIGNLVATVDDVNHQVKWTFYATDSDLQAMATNTADQTYTLKISDGQGGFDTQDVTITLAKQLNSAPIVTATTNATASVTEDAASLQPSGELIRDGNFEDMTQTSGGQFPTFQSNYLSYWDATGTVMAHGSGHANSGGAVSIYNPDPNSIPSAHGTLSQTFATVAGQEYTATFWVQDWAGHPVLNVSATGNAAMGIPLSAVSDSDFQQYIYHFTATGSSTTLTFDGSLSDGSIGIDDVSVISTESTSGTISFTDVDHADAHTVSSAAVGNGYLGTFTAWMSADSIGGGTGTVKWDYTVTDSVIASLGANDHIVQTYAVTINDGRGGITVQNVTITLNGLDGVQAVTNDNAYYAFIGSNPPANQPTAINFDADNIFSGGSDTFSFNIQNVFGSLGNLTINNVTGAVTGKPASGLNVFRIDATDLVTHETSFTYVAFSGMDGDTQAVTIGSSAGYTSSWKNDVVIVAANSSVTTAIDSGSGGDVVIGNGNANILNGSSENDALYGMGGNDTLDGGSNVDFLSGGDGNDTLIGGTDKNFLLGGAGNDKITGGDVEDFIIGGDGDDIINPGKGADLVSAGAGDDIINITDINDVLLDGGSGNDTLNVDVNYFAGVSDSVIVNIEKVNLVSNGTLDLSLQTEGFIIADTTGSGNTLIGSRGNDTIRGGVGNDTIDGGAGIDLLDFSDATSGISFTLTQSATAVDTGNLAGIGHDSYKNMEGVIGSSFADTLKGLGGNDILVGGKGNDTLSGGGGSDTFRYLAGDTALNSVDSILDFETGAGGDMIDLSGLLASVSGDKAQHVRFLYADNSTHLASQEGIAPPSVDGNVTLQVNLSGNTWTSVANITDTGSNLTAGSEVIKMMLDSSGSHNYHV